jgi:hypothetical protein
LDPTDVSQRATVSELYDLPFGKGSKFAASSNFVNRLIGGFQFNLIAVFQTGFPLAISGDSNNPYATRPNFTPGISPILSNRSKNEWFNTAAFSNAPAVAGNTFGNVPRTLANVRSPGAEEFDISMFKTTAITERTSLQFRVETFNTFNHVNTKIRIADQSIRCRLPVGSHLHERFPAVLYGDRKRGTILFGTPPYEPGSTPGAAQVKLAESFGSPLPLYFAT